MNCLNMLLCVILLFKKVKFVHLNAFLKRNLRKKKRNVVRNGPSKQIIIIWRVLFTKCYKLILVQLRPRLQGTESELSPIIKINSTYLIFSVTPKLRDFT
jgi:hypothetical protein